MDELGKIRRVVEKQTEIAEVLLVLDATTGQNGVAQAEAFIQHAGVTGLALRRESLQWRNMAALCHDPGMGR